MINAIQIGLGPLGQKIVQLILERRGINIVGAVDLDPEKVGKDLGELCSHKTLGIIISKDLGTALKGIKADVAILTTVSSIKLIENQIKEIAESGLNIVSTCEELSYPWQTNYEIAERIDKICKKYNVSCIGTGVNPGFLMDYLPCVLTSVCQKVNKIKITRIQNASERRIPFKKKIGAGLNLVDFKLRKEEGILRHVGLKESVYMIADCFRWKLDTITETLNPVIAEDVIISDGINIEKGYVRGIEQICKGYIGKEEVVSLYFKAAIAEEESFDMIEIMGEPYVKSIIPGGVNGDIATSAITINVIPSLMSVSPGLKTMLEIPVPGFFVH